MDSATPEEPKGGGKEGDGKEDSKPDGGGPLGIEDGEMSGNEGFG